MASIKIEVSKLHDKTGRRITGYRARFETAEGTGASPQLAVGALEKRMRELCSDSRDAHSIFQTNGHTVIIFRQFYGIKETMIYPDGHQSVTHCPDSTSIADCENAALMHIAQLTNDGSILRTDAARREFADWQEFQTRYRIAKEHGYSSNDCHNYALRNPQTPELWSRELLNPKLLREYRRARKEYTGIYLSGKSYVLRVSAKIALRSAKVRIAWQNAEWDEHSEPQAGDVRLRIVPDDSADLDDLKGDTFNPRCNSDIPRARLEREEKEFEEKVSREGVCGVIGEYFDGSKWQQADSCFGFVGDDWKDSGYDVDIMGETLEQAENVRETESQ